MSSRGHEGSDHRLREERGDSRQEVKSVDRLLVAGCSTSYKPHPSILANRTWAKQNKDKQKDNEVLLISLMFSHVFMFLIRVLIVKNCGHHQLLWMKRTHLQTSAQKFNAPLFDLVIYLYHLFQSPKAVFLDMNFGRWRKNQARPVLHGIIKLSTSDTFPLLEVFSLV